MRMCRIPGRRGSRSGKLDYAKEYYRTDESCRYMEEIHQMAVSGKSVSAAMGTQLPMPSWMIF